MLRKMKGSKIISVFLAIVMIVGIMTVSVPALAADTVFYQTDFSDYTGGLLAGWSDNPGNITYKMVEDEKYGKTLEMSSIKQYGNISYKPTGYDMKSKGLKIDMAVKVHANGRDAFQFFDYPNYIFAFYSGGFVGYKGTSEGSYDFKYADDIWYELSMTFVPSVGGLVFGTLTDENGITQKFSAKTGITSFSGELSFGMMESGSDPNLKISLGYIKLSQTDDIKAPGMDVQCDFSDASSPAGVAGFTTSQASYMSIADSGEPHGKVLACAGMPTGTMTQFSKAVAFSSGIVTAECSVMAGTNMRFEMFAEGSGTDDVSPYKYPGYFFPMSFGLTPGEMWIGCKPYDCAEEDVDKYKLAYDWKYGDWYRVRVIFDFDKKEMTMRIASETDPTNEIISTKALAFTALSEIVFACESQPNASEGSAPLYIDDLRIYEPAGLKLISSGVANGAAGVKITKPITFRFNMPIAQAEATLNDEPAVIVKNIYENEISVAPASGKLKLDTDYKLTLAGITDPFGNSIDDVTINFKTLDRFVDATAKFLDAAGSATTVMTAGNMKAEYSFAFTDGDPHDMLVLAGLYNKANNKCVKAVSKSFDTVTSGDGSFEFDVPTENPQDYKIVVYYWRGFNTLEPYAKTLSIGVN